MIEQQAIQTPAWQPTHEYDGQGGVTYGHHPYRGTTEDRPPWRAGEHVMMEAHDNLTRAYWFAWYAPQDAGGGELRPTRCMAVGRFTRRGLKPLFRPAPKAKPVYNPWGVTSG